jgi:non-ribosomal peptide synthetase component E (peptide arylation enzyme)
MLIQPAFLTLPLSKQYNTNLIKVKDVCEKELASYTMPYKYTFRDSFPKTNIGKVDFIAMENELKEEKTVNKQKKLTK